MFEQKLRQGSRSSTQEQCRKYSGFIPARYVIMALSFCGIGLQYILKVNLSVAIVAMVKTVETTEDNSNSLELDTCPGKQMASNSTDKVGSYDWDGKMQGNILSAYFYGYVATQLLGGRASDMFGSRHVLGTGVLFTGLLALASPLCAELHPAAFMTVRMMQGATSGVVIPAVQVIISKWFTKEERPQFVAIIMAGTYAGTLVAMGLSGVLIDIWGWPSVFYFFGALAVVFYIPWFFCGYDSPEKHPRISQAEREYILDGLEHTQYSVKDLPVPWISIVTSAPLWAFIIMSTGSSWLSYTLLTQLPTFAINVLHYNITTSGLVSALPYMFAWVSSNAFGALSSWLQLRGYISQITAYRLFNGICAIGSSLALLAITFIGCDATAIIVLLVLTAILKCGFYGGSIVNNLDLAPNFAGSTAGFNLTIANICGIVSPLVTGVIINGQQTLKQWNIVFYIAIAISTVSYANYFIFGSTKEQPWNKPVVSMEQQPKEQCKDNLPKSTTLSSVVTEQT